MRSLAGGVAVITGSGSGIGRALALELARNGSALALADVDPAGLAETAALVRALGTEPSEHVVDVADEAAVNAFAGEVLAHHGRATLVISNAGVAIFGTVAELAIDEIDWLMRVNFWGTVYVTKAFLGTLVAQPEAALVGISSIFGLFGPPGQSAYAASKFAVRGFLESLDAELRATNVDVCIVHPGGIKTNIARRARIARAADAAKAAGMTGHFERAFLTTPPERVAEAIVRAVKQRKRRLIVGSNARTIDLLSRLFPGSVGRRLARRASR
jgi:short-subunit dehydrogenase